MKGDGMQLHWRWTQTPEEKLLAQAADEPDPVAPPAADAAAPPASTSPAGTRRDTVRCSAGINARIADGITPASARRNSSSASHRRRRRVREASVSAG